MGTTKKRQSKRNTDTSSLSRQQAALSFLTNISLGNEQVTPTTLSIKERFAESSCTKLTRYGTLPVILLHKGSPGSIRVEHQEEQGNPSITLLAEQPVRQRKRSSTLGSYRHQSHSDSSSSSEIHQYKLTREDDTQRPIASEKVKKKLPTDENDNAERSSSISFMSVFRYYKGMIPARRKTLSHRYNSINSYSSNNNTNYNQDQYQHLHYHSYFHRHLSTLRLKHKKAVSYGHFLSHHHHYQSDTLVTTLEQLISSSSSSSNCSDEDEQVSTTTIAADCPSSSTFQPQMLQYYDPYYLGDGDFMIDNQGDTSTIKQLVNKKFHSIRPEINLTFSKIQSIKRHLLNIGKTMDLEISSVSHAYVYFEKLIQKQIVTKQNRKLIAACCLFLATKVNEPKGLWFHTLLEAIQSELNVGSKDVRNHEFAVFADLEFNLYVPLIEFMPHFEKIIKILKIQCTEDYLGNEPFYKFLDNQ